MVRTNPHRGKTDVAVNASIVIVFSEPVADRSLTSSSVRLLRGTTPVAGTVSLLQGSGTAAAFVPAASLDANTEYRLEVTRAVRDLDGDAVQAAVTVEFRTGQSSTGSPASLDLSPDSVFMSGTTYQMTATVRDAAGNILIDEPVTWSTSDPNGLAVSQTGLLTGLATELVPWLAGHMDVNAVDVTGVPEELMPQVEELATENVKRVHRAPDADPFSPEAQSPYEITALMEFKTVWHPVGA